MTLPALKTFGISDGMSDDQWLNEIYAQRRTRDALASMRDAFNIIFMNTVVAPFDKRRCEQAFDDFVHDHIPDFDQWDSLISEARNP